MITVLVKSDIINTILCNIISPCLPSEELSDEYQTDYDEEAVESAVSDFET